MSLQRGCRSTSPTSVVVPSELTLPQMGPTNLDNQARMKRLKDLLKSGNLVTSCNSCGRRGCMSVQKDGERFILKCTGQNPPCFGKVRGASVFLHLQELNKGSEALAEVEALLLPQSAKKTARQTPVPGSFVQLTIGNGGGPLRGAPARSPSVLASPTRTMITEAIQDAVTQVASKIDIVMKAVESMSQRLLKVENEMSSLKTGEDGGVSSRPSVQPAVTPTMAMIVARSAALPARPPTAGHRHAAQGPHSQNSSDATGAADMCARPADGGRAAVPPPRVVVVRRPTKPLPALPEGDLTEAQAASLAASLRVPARKQPYIPFCRMYVHGFVAGPLGAIRKRLAKLGVSPKPLELSFLGRSNTLELTLHSDKAPAVEARLTQLGFKLTTGVAPEDSSFLTGQQWKSVAPGDRAAEGRRVYAARLRREVEQQVRPSVRGFLLKELQRVTAAAPQGRAQAPTSKDGFVVVQTRASKQRKKRRTRRSKQAPASCPSQRPVSCSPQQPAGQDSQTELEAGVRDPSVLEDSCEAQSEEERLLESAILSQAAASGSGWQSDVEPETASSAMRESAGPTVRRASLPITPRRSKRSRRAVTRTSPVRSA